MAIPLGAEALRAVLAGEVDPRPLLRARAYGARDPTPVPVGRP